MKKTSRNKVERVLRNTRALIGRLALAVRHRDEAEVLKATIMLVENSAWMLCVLSVAACLVAGFFKPHCFVMAGVCLVVAGIIRANIEDFRNGTLGDALDE